ncbi:NurA-like 5'-3' nuclease [Methanococcus maripaludis]|uniref:NurA-like 5'-3' nuclease n=1 Tax=Methanococcus maripaludis TaxID=39152 RepID=A0A7J9NPM7_METMI|nr:DNA double-strand break repair nuclease NurA [Methanococcus maripaludis]MBA2847106.1 NurA-like 5'-3' nuclease [Methanococcus maripaludis]
MDYSKLLSKKEDICSKIKNIDFNFDYESYWNNCDFNNHSNAVFAGGDGSFNKIDYINYCLYISGAVSYIQKTGGRVEESVSSWDSNIILPYRYVQSRLSLYMLNMELKVALWNLKNEDIDYYLYDGSLYSLLIQTNNKISINGESLENSIFRYYELYGNEIKNKIFEEIDSKNINSSVEISNNSKFSEEEKIILEQLEYLILLSEILKYREKIVGVAKTSKMNIYFKDALIPDLAIFSRCKNPGYSKPLDLVDEKINKNFYKNVEYFKKFGIDLKKLNYQFLKLDNNNGTLCITSFEELDEDFFSNIQKISVSGYPYILKKSHENVKIEKKEIEKFAKLLGIYEKTDRDSNLEY